MNTPTLDSQDQDQISLHFHWMLAQKEVATDVNLELKECIWGASSRSMF